MWEEVINLHIIDIYFENENYVTDINFYKKLF